MNSISINDLDMNQALDGNILGDVVGRGYSAWSVSQTTLQAHIITINPNPLYGRGGTVVTHFRQTGVRYKTTHHTVRTMVK